MRRVIASIFVTLDGVVEDPRGAEGFELGGWSLKYSGRYFGLVRGGGGSGKPSAGKIMMGLARDSPSQTLSISGRFLYLRNRNWSLEDK